MQLEYLDRGLVAVMTFEGGECSTTKRTDRRRLLVDVRAALQAFLEALSGNGAKEIDVQQGMLHLLGSVQHAIMASGIHPNRLFRGVNMYAELSQMREPQRIVQWFHHKVASPFLEEDGQPIRFASEADDRAGDARPEGELYEGHFSRPTRG